MPNGSHAPMIEAALRLLPDHTTHHQICRALAAALRQVFIEFVDEMDPPPLMTWLSETASELDG